MLVKIGKINGTNEYRVQRGEDVIGYLWRIVYRGGSYKWNFYPLDTESPVCKYDTFKEAKAALLA